MNTTIPPAGQEQAAMATEAQLDRLLDAVEAPKPSAALRARLYALGAWARPAPRGSLLARLGGWLAAGPGLRPAAGMAAMACMLAIGVAIGTALPEASSPEAPPRLAAAEPAAASAPLVVAGFADLTGETDPLSIDGIRLVAPQLAPVQTAEAQVTAEYDGVGDLPLY